MRKIPLVSQRLLACVFLSCATSAVAAEEGPFQATGFKIGEVTSTSAVIWTRLTRYPHRNPADGPQAEVQYVEDEVSHSRRRGIVKAVVFPEGATAEDLAMAVPGAAGEVRVRCRPSGQTVWQNTAWLSVDPDKDYTRQFCLGDLLPDQRYEIEIEGRCGAQAANISRLNGQFVTAPSRDRPARVVFTVSTGQGNNGQDRDDGFEIYPSMLKLSPSFFVHTGDIVYYDRLAKTLPLARYHWQRTYSWPTNVQFHRQVASYFEKDDHDTWMNDCWPTMRSGYMYQFTFAQGQAVFREQVPIGPQTYRTFRWGRDLQIWLVEGRDYRSPNDAADGPAKTIWGAEQKAWFKRTVERSDATFRILISPTPLVGPDRSKKSDNHANQAFETEGRELRDFLSAQNNMVVLCGDRHWQYMSVDPRTGLREYSCGPASDQHAGGWRQSDWVPEYHRFLRVKGGFLSVTVERTEDDVAQMTLRFHDVLGNVKFEDQLPSAAGS